MTGKPNTGPRHRKHGLHAAAGPEHFLWAVMAVVNARPKKEYAFEAVWAHQAAEMDAEAVLRLCSGRLVRSAWNLLAPWFGTVGPAMHGAEPPHAGGAMWQLCEQILKGQWNTLRMPPALLRQQRHYRPPCAAPPVPKRPKSFSFLRLKTEGVLALVILFGPGTGFVLLCFLFWSWCSPGVGWIMKPMTDVYLRNGDEWELVPECHEVMRWIDGRWLDNLDISLIV